MLSRVEGALMIFTTASATALSAAFSGLLGLAQTPRELASHAERWRPWRSYAAQALWNYEPGDAA